MLNTDITEISAMPMACIFANAFGVWVGRAGFNANCRHFGGIYICLPEIVRKKTFKSSKLEATYFDFRPTWGRSIHVHSRELRKCAGWY